MVNNGDAYDPNNIFARILRGEIPCREILRDEWALAFRDINPQAPVHALVIPTGAYVSLADFTGRASADEIAGFWRAVGRTAEMLGLVDGGYRVLSNAGGDSHQEVPHLHVHVFGGRALGPMLAVRPGA